MSALAPPELRIERLPSRNQPWRPARVSRRELAVVAVAAQADAAQLQRAFWTLWGDRRKGYRLLRVDRDGIKHLVACNRTRKGRPTRPLYLAELWRELPSEPGTFVRRLDLDATAALLACVDDAAAKAAFDALPRPRDRAGHRLSRCLSRALPSAGRHFTYQTIVEDTAP